MREIEFCPECGAPVVGFTNDQRCTSCGLTYLDMLDLLDGDDLMEDDFGPDDVDGDLDGSDYGDEESDSDEW
ncbi:MAG: hypothetical protein ACKODP_04215 [Actinomycetota bacterium]